VFHALRFAREGLFGDIHTKAGHRLAHPVRATHASTGAGPEGHSIVAEIAQRRLTPEAAAKVREILGENASLASIASWANDYRAVHLIPLDGVSSLSRLRRRTMTRPGIAFDRGKATASFTNLPAACAI
jgi:hypothetical protein